MTNYKRLEGLMAYYKNVIKLCEVAGVGADEIKWRLGLCLYMLGWEGPVGREILEDHILADVTNERAEDAEQRYL